MTTNEEASAPPSIPIQEYHAPVLETPVVAIQAFQSPLHTNKRRLTWTEAQGNQLVSSVQQVAASLPEGQAFDLPPSGVCYWRCKDRCQVAVLRRIRGPTWKQRLMSTLLASTGLGSSSNENTTPAEQLDWDEPLLHLERAVELVQHLLSLGPTVLARSGEHSLQRYLKLPNDEQTQFVLDCCRALNPNSVQEDSDDNLLRLGGATDSTVALFRLQQAHLQTTQLLEHWSQQSDQSRLRAVRHKTNHPQRALLEWKRHKQCAQRAQQLQGTLLNLEACQFALQQASQQAATLQALHQTTQVLQELRPSLATVDDVLLEVQDELSQLQQVDEALGTSVVDGVDLSQDDLLEELEQLTIQDEAPTTDSTVQDDSKKKTNMDPGTPTPTVPTNQGTSAPTPLPEAAS